MNKRIIIGALVISLGCLLLLIVSLLHVSPARYDVAMLDPAGQEMCQLIIERPGGWTNNAGGAEDSLFMHTRDVSMTSLGAGNDSIHQALNSPDLQIDGELYKWLREISFYIMIQADKSQ